MRAPAKLISAVLLFLAIACSDSTAPGTLADASPSFQRANSAEARHAELKQLLEAEKERIKQEREQGRLEFEIARAQWKVFKEELKRAGKAGLGGTQLLRCAPRPLEGDAAIIGPQGGTLHIGAHELVIPKGALTEEQLIVGRAPTSSLVDVELQPEGLQFQREARLTLSYKGCSIPAAGDLSVAYVGIGNRILELPASEDHPAESAVTGEIHHFSRYAVAF